MTIWGDSENHPTTAPPPQLVAGQWQNRPTTRQFLESPQIVLIMHPIYFTQEKTKM